MPVFIHLLPFPEQKLQLLLQPVLIRKYRKPVGADMTAVVDTKQPAKQPGQTAQQLIPFRESVLVVVMLHPAEINIQ